jgi:transcription-repair coupling factor (superfamily II helicase)
VILNELKKWAVYFVHDRVQSIEKLIYLKKYSEIKIVAAYGQMKPAQLESNSWVS